MRILKVLGEGIKHKVKHAFSVGCGKQDGRSSSRVLKLLKIEISLSSFILGILRITM